MVSMNLEKCYCEAIIYRTTGDYLNVRKGSRKEK